MCMRLSLALKQPKIMSLISNLQGFIDTYKHKSSDTKSVNMQLLCLVQVAVPIVSGVAFVILFVNDNEDLKAVFHSHFSFGSKSNKCTEIIANIFNIYYVFYLYITPSLCMTLLFFMYETYQSSFKRMLIETCHLLSTDLSFKNLSDATQMILRSTKIHKEIENVFSLCTFLSYILVFVNFLHVVTLNVSEVICPYIKFRIMSSAVIFLWTISNFVRLTLIGTKIIDVCDTWKLLQKTIVKACTQAEDKSIDKLTHLLLFLEVTRIDLAFTGWSMFRLDRRLLLTMSEAIISFSVLIVTL
ncbi:uncharacterized protein TNCT_683911 [Trichonephila clavata]|uniref:Uncharacterized protein n=1 Tax=Trichonephila clavata TaxID=2740835 RepID=A0A8X6H5X7_TRICU|nr:uncharacterized protein TNCT_683911 [Trichonephila clavata]